MFNKITARVYRYDPSKDKVPRYETYEVPYSDYMRILDVLKYIRREIDGSLAFRYSCKESMCGSCAVLVNGSPKLACDNLAEQYMVIEPLPNLPVIKDLVVDRSESEEKLKRTRPYLIRRGSPEKGLIKITPEEMKPFIQMSKCIECLACYAVCPVIESDKFVSPVGSVKLAEKLFHKMDEGDRLQDAIEQGLYCCTTCSECEISCPKELSPVDAIIDTRRVVVEKGQVPPTIRDALESVFKNGNPWGIIRSKRSDWAHDLKVKHFSKGMELLYFVGCTPSYDPHAQEMARSLVKCFNEARVDFGTLGNEESCCGNEVYMIGEKGLFDFLVEENQKAFNKYEIKRIVTTSPHCYDAFKNRYKKTNFEVQHYTEYVADLIDRGKLKFSRALNKKVTYQDPCSLGKRNGVYDEPRKIIESIPEVNFIEMHRSRERSVCCSGGGGRMWYDVPGERIAEMRVKEAIEVGAEILATACPFCLLTLEDAAKTGGFEGTIQIMDITELLSKSI